MTFDLITQKENKKKDLNQLNESGTTLIMCHSFDPDDP